MTDQKLRNNFFDKIITEVNKIENNETLFYDIVNNKIKNVFEEAFINRLNEIYKKSEEAQNLEKRRLFIDLKKFIIKNRIL